MKKKTKKFMTVLAGILAGMCIMASAHAQSITIVNNSGCIQWIHLRNSNGKVCVRQAMAINADATFSNAKGQGISQINGGPTKAIQNCCYSSKINASVSLSGTNWRVDIDPSGLKVIDRDSLQIVFSAAGEFGKCVSDQASGIMGGAIQTGEPQSQRD